MVIGDLNNDKKLDLVVAGAKNRSIAVLLGKGDGQFAVSASSTTVPHPPHEIALGDVNLDGKLDLAVATHDSYGVLLLLGDGNGGFTTAPTSPIVMRDGNQPHTHGLALADMNRDNKLDLVTVNSTDNDVSLALGDGRGGFTRAPGSPFAVGPSPYPFAIGDVNGDGQPRYRRDCYCNWSIESATTTDEPGVNSASRRRKGRFSLQPAATAHR